VEWDEIQSVEDFLAWVSEFRGSPYHRSLERARQDVADIDPQVVARRSGATYKALGEGEGFTGKSQDAPQLAGGRNGQGGGGGSSPQKAFSLEEAPQLCCGRSKAAGFFTLPFLEQNYHIAYPGFKMVSAATGEEPSVYRQIILLHYLRTVDDAYVPAGFVAFGALPHGRPYEHALQRSALAPLARTYADNPNHLRLASQALGGRPLDMEDGRSLAFSFWPLPRLPMGVALTPSDGEFPVRAQLLVDVNTDKWLPVYDTAIVGRLLCQTLERLKPVGGRAVKLSEILDRDDGALYVASP
jgi:hypothetical protein